MEELKLNDKARVFDPSRGGRGYPAWFRLRVLSEFDASLSATVEEKMKDAASQGVSQSSIYRWLSLRRNAGSVLPRPVSGGSRPLLSDEAKVAVLLYMTAYPSARLKDHVSFLAWLFAENPVQTDALQRWFSMIGITRKSLTTMAIEFQPMREYSWWHYSPPIGCRRVPVWRMVDSDESYSYYNESGCDVGWSLKGIPAYERRKHQKGTKITIIASISLDGVVGYWLLSDENTTGAVFSEYLETYLFPNLSDYPRFLLMDNLRSHLTATVLSTVHRSPHKLLLRPPYHPSVAPIELLFAHLKSELRARFHVLRFNTFKHAIGEILDAVTPAQCRAWFAHCGYRV